MRPPWMVVFRKEIVDAWRDRRALKSALLFAWLGPVLIGAVFVALVRDAREDAVIHAQIAGRERAPALAEFLEQNQVVLSPALADAAAAVAGKQADAVISISRDYAQNFGQMRPARIELVKDPSHGASRKAAERLRKLILVYAARTTQARLMARGVSPAVSSPLMLEDVDTSMPSSSAAQALALLPGFLLVTVFVAGMNTANDCMAGERERGSLEPLLLNPLSTTDLVIGKWLATSAFSALGIVLTLSCAIAVLRLAPIDADTPQIQLAGASLLWMLAVTLPLAVLASGLQLLISTVARTPKEGQAYLSTLMLVPMLLGFLGEFFPLDLNRLTLALPILGQQHMLSDIVHGQVPAAVALLASALVALMAAAGCIFCAGRLLRNERAILGR